MESASDAKYTGLIKRIGKWTMILGIANAVFYLLHDIIGAMNYPGYKWMEQAVSDLTAEDSPAPQGGYLSFHRHAYGIKCGIRSIPAFGTGL